MLAVVFISGSQDLDSKVCVQDCDENAIGEFYWTIGPYQNLRGQQHLLLGYWALLNLIGQERIEIFYY